MMRVDVRHDIDRIVADLGALPAERMAAAVRAANRTLTSARADSARRLAREYVGVKIAEIKRRVRLERATQKKPRAALVFSGRRIPLYGNFGMTAAGKWGVRFRGLPWRLETVSGEPVTAEMMRRLFRQRSRRTGRADVFSRHTAKRTSFDLVLAPGLARALAERNIGEALEKAIRARFGVVFKQELRFRVGRR